MGLIIEADEVTVEVRQESIVLIAADEDLLAGLPFFAYRSAYRLDQLQKGAPEYAMTSLEVYEGLPLPAAALAEQPGGTGEPGRGSTMTGVSLCFDAWPAAAASLIGPMADLARALEGFAPRPSGLLVPPAPLAEAYTSAAPSTEPPLTAERLHETFAELRTLLPPPVDAERAAARVYAMHGGRSRAPTAEQWERLEVEAAEGELEGEYQAWRERQGMAQPTPAQKRLLSRWTRDCQDLPQLVEAWMLGR